MERVKKVSALIRKNIQAREVKENNLGRFASWFLVAGRTKLVSIMECAKAIANINPDIDVTDKTVQGYISQIRRVLEHKKGVSIWNVKGEGYRIATEPEKAIFLVKGTHRVLKLAERVSRLYVITDKKLIPGAINTVFGSKEKARIMLKGSNRSLGMICSSQKLLTNGR